jgi:tRNA (guanine-N7-)-methyltransferase
MEKQLIRSFGRIHGKKLSARQQWLAENLLPQLSPIHDSRLTTRENREAILEIGFGAGEHLLELARENPDSLIIGAEPFMNGVASLLSRMCATNDEITELRNDIIKPECQNIRIWPDDVRKLLSLCNSVISSLQNPDLIFNQIWILHPDPWPKARHEKRRLCSAEFLGLLARHLAPEGKIIIGTDHYGYYDWVMEQARQSKLQITELRNDGIITTRYQKKNKAGTAEPKYLALSRK